jgi:hypothetical protein
MTFGPDFIAKVIEIKTTIETGRFSGTESPATGLTLG